jgi:hypothetical protein
MAEQSKCPVCSEKATPIGPYQGGGTKFACIRCGTFEIGTIAAHQISLWSHQQLVTYLGGFGKTKIARLLVQIWDR